MRMWGVQPKLLCDKHLLGEHVEMHMVVGALRKGVSIRGYTDTGLLVRAKIRPRHDALAAEMTRRGMNHRSPLPPLPPRRKTDGGGWLDEAANLRELKRRCPACCKRIRRAEAQARKAAAGK